METRLEQTEKMFHEYECDDIIQVQDSKKCKFFQHRYLVFILGFFTNALMSCHMISTSIGLVAMVKISTNNSHRYSNISDQSCPMNIENTTKVSNLESEGDFDWSPKIQGYILGCSSVGLFLTCVAGGLLSEKIGAKFTITAAIFVSSLCHLLSPFAAWGSSYFMIAMQFLRGMGQGLIPPSNLVLATNWTPRNERGIVIPFIMTGMCVGTIIGGVASGAICSSSVLGRWPSVFYIFGGLGIGLSLIYLVFIFDTPQHHPRIRNSELAYILQNQEMDLSKERPATPWVKILTSVPFYAMTIATFGQYWSSAHFMSVNPIFLGRILHFSIKKNGLLSSVPYLLQIVFTFSGSWLSGWLLKNNHLGLNKNRKVCNFISCLGYSVCVLGMYFAGCRKTTSSVFSFLAIGFGGVSFSGCMLNPVDLSPTFTGTLMGLSSLISVTASYIVPVLVGYLTSNDQSLEQWSKFFFISITVVMSSGIIFCLFGSAEVQPWNYPKEEDIASYIAERNGETMSHQNIHFKLNKNNYI